MSVRDDIVNAALEWSSPSQYKPVASELVGFFTDANTRQVPSQAEAQKSLDTLVTGCYLGGRVKQWCGIFACSVAADVGLNSLWWDLSSGLIRGTQVRKIWGHGGIQPGDIGIIAHYSHHFIVTDANESDWNGTTVQLLDTVEGNTAGQFIRANTRRLSEIVAYYQIQV